MDLLTQNDTHITLRLTIDEAVAINNALNETLETFDTDEEFETRIGVTKTAVSDLLAAFSPMQA